MKPAEYSWKSREGEEIYGCEWPAASPKGVICLVHGMGEHINRYEGLAQKLNEAGWAVLGYDQPGHGRTSGARGHVGSYDLLLDEVDVLLLKAKEKYSGLPVFLYGHSMGGNVVLNYLLRRNPDVKGAIVTSPWLRLPQPPPAIKYYPGLIMRKIFPKFTESTALDTKAISRDAAVVAAYEADPLVHDKISTAFFFGCYEAAKYALDHASELKKPVLLMHGTADKLTAFSGSEEFAAKAGKMVKFIPWKDAYHELHFEPEKDNVIQQIIAFLA